jgi:protein O-mannosyl-transferase
MEGSRTKRDIAWTPAFGLLTIVVFTVYLPAVFNDFVDWDDLSLIIQNPRFNHPTLETIGYYAAHPFVSLYMPVTCALWAALGKIGSVTTADALGAQINPYIFHLASVLLHLLATCAVFAILCRITKTIWPALAGATLFALHPLQVESVAFVGAMNTVLAAALPLAALSLYLRSTNELKNSRPWFKPAYILATLLFAAALLSKPTAIVAPAMALLLDRLVNRRTFRAAALSIFPWVLLTVPCLIWTLHFQHGAMLAASEPLWTRPIVAADASTFYVRKLLVPLQLGIDYGQTPPVILQHSRAWLILPMALLLSIVLFRNRLPIIATGIALFLVGMLPNSGLIPFDYQQFSTVADRYIYLSMLGVAIVFAGCLARMNWRIGFALVIAVFASCVILTELQVRTWRNGETLFRHAIQINPQSWMSRSNLAIVIMDRSPDEAIAQCQAAIEREPTFTPAWGNLGSALMLKGNKMHALGAFAQAYKLDPINPPFPSNYARALADTGHYSESARIYRQILDRDPSSTDAKAGLERVTAAH